MKKVILTTLLIFIALAGSVVPAFAESDSLSNYYQLDYLIVGDGNYIDTNTPLFDGTTFRIDTKMSFSSVSSIITYGSTYRDTGLIRINNQYQLAVDMPYSWELRNKTLSLNTNYHIVLEMYSDKSFLMQVDDTNRTVNVDPQVNDYARLFNQPSTNTYFNGKVYYLKIYRSNNLIFDLIPVQRISDNEVGFWNQATNEFVGNDGTGTFRAGNILSTTYTITTSSSPVLGGSVSGGGTYPENSEITLTATPSTDYEFSQWSDGNTSNPRTITVSGDQTYTAIFTELNTTKYNITTSSSPVLGGSVSGGGRYSENSTIILSATANSGYQFSQWSDGNTSNPRTIIVSGDQTYAAIFSPIMYDISVSVSPLLTGSVSGGGNYPYGSEVILTATSNPGYQFSQWSDGNTSNPRTIIVSGNQEYIAEFESINIAQYIGSKNINITNTLYSVSDNADIRTLYNTAELINYVATNYGTSSAVVDNSYTKYYCLTTFNPSTFDSSDLVVSQELIPFASQLIKKYNYTDLSYNEFVLELELYTVSQSGGGYINADTLLSGSYSTYSQIRSQQYTRGLTTSFNWYIGSGTSKTIYLTEFYVAGSPVNSILRTTDINTSVQRSLLITRYDINSVDFGSNWSYAEFTINLSNQDYVVYDKSANITIISSNNSSYNLKINNDNNSGYITFIRQFSTYGTYDTSTSIVSPSFKFYLFPYNINDYSSQLNSINNGIVQIKYLLDDLQIQEIDNIYQDIQNTYNINIENNISDLIGDLEFNLNQIDLTDSKYQIPESNLEQISNLSGALVNGIIEVIDDSGLSIIYILPLVAIIIGVVL